ncbi:hypothetical protein PanWU01x14_339590 [Parasponia andersonii]|uniref:Uncharacterized protein n=1 Tax=Parasponia andersonii TaxID=3476 RepID=A0A2P5AES2_PARAD|nr:hypothetical protein PanWU01x14_339590 [Parasponia andersonii]
MVGRVWWVEEGSSSQWIQDSPIVSEWWWHYGTKTRIYLSSLFSLPRNIQKSDRYTVYCGGAKDRRSESVTDHLSGQVGEGSL